MSKERELLKRWFNDFGIIQADIKLLRDTQELLAKPEQEPVYIVGKGWQIDGMPEMGLKLYTTPPIPEPIAYVADSSVGLDVSKSVQGMPLIWLGKLKYGDKLYKVGKDE